MRFFSRAAVVVLAGLALVPLTGDYAAAVGSLAVVLALVALGFIVLTGWTGDIALGQIVPYGLGAYATFWLSARADVPVALAILLAAFVVAPLVALIGLAALRLSGLELAVATLASAVVAQLLLFPNLGQWLGGRVPTLTEFSSTVVRVDRPHVGPISLEGNRAFYIAALVVTGLAYAAVTAVGRSQVGRGLRAVRDDPIRAEALGLPVGQYRLLAFIVAGMLAALAGALAASLRGAITAESFTLFESINFLAVAVIGGLAVPGGALLAGGFGALLPELARLESFRFLQGRLTFVYGAGLLALLIARPGGLAALLAWDRRPRHEHAPPRPRPVMPAPGRRRTSMLRIDDLTVAFGGVHALDDVSLRVAAGDEVAVIGPNGAGKSTLFQAIDGLLTPDHGRVFFDGADITRWPAHRRAQAGIARTFQLVRAFESLTVAEHLAVAGNEAVAANLIERLGLASHAADLPAALPYGALRTLEVAMALATSPRVLLLDEPTAGMDPLEAARFCDLLAEVNAELGLTLLLVEHDMAVVGRLARRVVVLDRGRIIADGDPDAIANDPLVIASYLGTTSQNELTRAAR